MKSTLTNQFRVLTLLGGLTAMSSGLLPVGEDFVTTALAQRQTDKLDRGLIAVPASGAYQVSWRLLGEEYYDVTFNLYRDGQLIAEGLQTSNYQDKEGKATSQYAVSAVVRGVEQEKCAPVLPWSDSYKLIKPTHEGIKSTLIPNDACCADVDGDGELEIIMKYDNASEAAQSYPKNGPKINGVDTKEYSIFEVLKLDGTRLWWVNCGPNMGDFQNNEQNMVGYDWDGDGCAEVVMRAADGTTIHLADGTTYTVGNATANVRAANGGGTNWFVITTGEYLLYLDGKTGKPFDCQPYPLKLYEDGETDYVKAWEPNTGKHDGGHRASKHFFGAPYLDGHKPSIFLARGIYTRHKMIALDVDPQTHKLKERWRWFNKSNGPWKGQGFHNFLIADVDEDGRDEIVYGNMVIDDNGKGLSTTGLGHGDAQHCSDFNPYAKGLEIYDCLEDNPGNCYRDGTTAKIYHRNIADRDDGRAMMGNFTDSYPGSLGCSAREGAISSITGSAVSGMSATGVNTNFRIYWDGDLCSETFNGVTTNDSEGCVAKYGSWTPIYTCTGSLTNNYTKATPCYQGDILGDWREEIIMRDADNNIRIYSTPTVTTYRIPTLWSDHQYRYAMVWQMCGYNQPPHVSYFVGKLEGITLPPPPLTTTGREVITSGATVGAQYDGKHVLLADNGDTQLSLAEGAKPYILTLNVPSWVQGSAPSECTNKQTAITYTYYTCNVTAGSLAGEARLVKQGDGTLNLPATTFTHSGETKIWGGVLNFDGQMPNSDLWLNRFTTLNSNGGKFKSITALYDTKLCPGGDKLGTLTADSVYMDFGSRLVVNINGENCDLLKTRALQVIKKSGLAWTQGGPKYLQPVIELRGANIEAGEYVIAECEKLYGSLTNLKVEGVQDLKTGLRYENGKIILTLGSTRGASNIYWLGDQSITWDYATAQNFVLTETGEKDVFVHGDLVEFSDEAKRFNVNIVGDLSVDTVKFVNETQTYTLMGEGHIVTGALVKEGAGTLKITNTNSYKGGNYLRGGVVEISALANDVQEQGNLGSVTSIYSKFVMENGAELKTTAAVTNGSVMTMVGEQGGIINNSADFTQQKGISGTVLTKKGTGLLIGNSACSVQRLILSAGTVRSAGGNMANVIEFAGGSLVDWCSTSNQFYLPKGKKGTWSPSNSCTYTNKLTGEGTLTVYCPVIKGNTWYATRTPLALDFSDFEGTLTAQVVYADDGRFSLSTNKGGSKFILNIPAKVIVQNESKTLRVGQVTGSGDLGGYCKFTNNNTGASGINTWEVGNDGNFTFGGRVVSSDIFTKLGKGIMTATGKWTTTGKVTVKEGTLKVGGSATLGTGALEVALGATLQPYSSSPTQAIESSSVTVRGTLFPTVTGGSIGVALFNNQNVTFMAGSTLRLGILKKSTSSTVTSGCYLNKIGTLTLNGTISLFFDYMPAVGDEIRLWKNVTTAKGNPTIKIDEKMVIPSRSIRAASSQRASSWSLASPRLSMKC